MKKILVVLLLVLTLSLGLSAQVVPTPSFLTNVYAGGISYSVNATPGIAGTGLYARALNSSGTYAFTVIDAVPNTLKPFTVTSNVGVGVAQKVTLVGHSVYLPTAAGISWNGTNTGWQWNGGVLVPVYEAKGLRYYATARFLKSSVSNGSGYQPIIGLLIGWGN